MKTVKTVKSKTTKPAAKTPAVAPARKLAVKATVAKAPSAPAAAPRREITSEIIAARAYTIWEQKGRPQGGDLENWLLAESQLKQEIQSFTA
jgi:hypothetical protein